MGFGHNNRFAFLQSAPPLRRLPGTPLIRGFLRMSGRSQSRETPVTVGLGRGPILIWLRHAVSASLAFLFNPFAPFRLAAGYNEYNGGILHPALKGGI